MTKHTPGPWQYAAKLSGSENHKGYYIGSEGWALGFVQPGDENGELGEANARLIAAAPELLEALGLLRDAVQLGEPTGIAAAWATANHLLKELQYDT